MSKTASIDPRSERDLKVERRAVEHLELRESPTKGPGLLVGYSAVFDRWSVDLGGFREIIAPGAFTSALRDAQDVRALVQHDPGMILGRSTSGTLKMIQDGMGLRVEIDLPDTTVGRDTAVSVSRRDLTGMSFSFSVRGAEGETWERVGNEIQRTLRDLDLFDVGPVTYPAYPDTSVALRSLDQAFSERVPAIPEPEASIEAPSGPEPELTPAMILAHFALIDSLKSS